MTAFSHTRLQDVIQSSIPLPAKDNSGFHSMRCQVCNDYKVRAGFKFDADKVIYNCWNCSTAAVYTELSGSISKKFRSILHAYGVDDAEISAAVNSSFFVTATASSHSLSSLTQTVTTTPPDVLPAGSLRLGHSDQFLDQQQPLIEYLTSRCVDAHQHSFYFSTGPRFKNRVIIPFYRNGQLIYWQARSIDAHEKKRWDNSPMNRTAVMYNMDALAGSSAAPLLVTEGVFDAMMFGGVALCGSKLNDSKIALLRTSRRELVFVVDKDSNGRSLAQAALANGWSIAFVPPGCRDLNHSVQRLGRAWTAYYIATMRPHTADQAQLAIDMNCI